MNELDVLTRKELKELLEEAIESNTQVEVDIYGNVYGIKQANAFGILKTLIRLLGEIK